MSTRKTKTAENETAKGLVCPKCGCRHLLVVYTRPKLEHVLRVRACRHCGKRMMTRERLG